MESIHRSFFVYTVLTAGCNIIFLAKALQFTRVRCKQAK